MIFLNIQNELGWQPQNKHISHTTPLVNMPTRVHHGRCKLLIMKDGPTLWVPWWYSSTSQNALVLQLNNKHILMHPALVLWRSRAKAEALCILWCSMRTSHSVQIEGSWQKINVMWLMWSQWVIGMYLLEKKKCPGALMTILKGMKHLLAIKFSVQNSWKK